MVERLERVQVDPTATTARAERLTLFSRFGAYRVDSLRPADRREYGYYVLPILHGDRLIGRIDPVLDRKRRVLDRQRCLRRAAGPS